MHTNNKFSEDEKQKIVMCLDMAGWEQQGKGLNFYNPSLDSAKNFSTWYEAYKFVLKIYGKEN
jgi:hypothetical protein